MRQHEPPVTLKRLLAAIPETGRDNEPRRWSRPQGNSGRAPDVEGLRRLPVDVGIRDRAWSFAIREAETPPGSLLTGSGDRSGSRRREGRGIFLVKGA